MNIAELFINLGVKGNDKAVNALGSVQKGLGEVKSMSLEAKAGILAALYAFERLTVGAAQAGAGLKNFETLTGISAETLQRYQYAARQVGVSNEEVEGSFKSLQNVMSAVRRGEGVPAGAKYLSGLIGGFDPEKLKDIPSMMQELQRASQANIDPAMKRWALGTFGIGDGIQVAMSRNAFNADVMSRAPIRSEGMIQGLAKVNTAWANLSQKISMGFDQFTLKHGAQVIKDISNITNQVFKLIDALTILAEKVKLFSLISDATSGIANTLKLVVELMEKFSGKESKKGDLLYTKPGEDLLPGFKDSPFAKWFMSMLNYGAPKESLDMSLPPGYSHFTDPAAPRLGREPQSVKTQTFDTTVNMNFQHDGKDSVKTVNSVKDAVKQSYRQMSAQLQGS